MDTPDRSEAADKVSDKDKSAAGTSPIGADELSLWSRLAQHHCPEARARLLERHLPYSRVVAASYFARRHDDTVEFADYLQYAALGMIEAIDRFDPQRGVQFRTFAARRMHGAILNGLEHLTERHQQWSAHRRILNERLAAAKDLAAQRTGFTESGTAGSTDQLFRYVADVGLGLALCWLLEGTSMVEDADRAECIPFYRSAAVEQRRQRLLHSIDALPAQERTVIRCHYLQQLPFEQVARQLKLSKGRISQIHKQAMLRLRAMMTDHAGLDVAY